MSRSIPFVAVVTGDRLLQINLLDMLIRDRRVHSCRDWAFSSSQEVQEWVAGSPRPVVDVILIDVMFLAGDAAIMALITAVKELWPDVAIVCLGQNPSVEMLRGIVRSGGRGYLCRTDVVWGLPATLALVPLYSFVCTPTVESTLRNVLVNREYYCVPQWDFYKGLRPAEQTFAELVFLRGMANEPACEVAGYTKQTGNTIKGRIRLELLNAVEEGWYDTALLPELSDTRGRLDDVAVFNLLTSLPAPSMM
jgi:hypothetical protein